MAKKVLVIDDEFEDLNTMKTILEKNSYEVTPVTNGKKALEMMSHKRFDLILLDILLPTLSGYELLRIMREKFNHGLKLVYVSILPEKEANLDGADGFIQKPFSPESLLEGVKKALAKEKNHKKGTTKR